MCANLFSKESYIFFSQNGQERHQIWAFSWWGSALLWTRPNKSQSAVWCQGRVAKLWQCVCDRIHAFVCRRHLFMIYLDFIFTFPTLARYLVYMCTTQALVFVILLLGCSCVAIFCMFECCFHCVSSVLQFTSVLIFGFPTIPSPQSNGAASISSSFDLVYRSPILNHVRPLHRFIWSIGPQIWTMSHC